LHTSRGEEWKEEFEERMRQFKEPLRVEKKGSEREDSLEIY